MSSSSARNDTGCRSPVLLFRLPPSSPPGRRSEFRGCRRVHGVEIAAFPGAPLAPVCGAGNRLSEKLLPAALGPRSPRAPVGGCMMDTRGPSATGGAPGLGGGKPAFREGRASNRRAAAIRARERTLLVPFKGVMDAARIRASWRQRLVHPGHLRPNPGAHGRVLRCAGRELRGVVSTETRPCSTCPLTESRQPGLSREPARKGDGRVCESVSHSGHRPS